MSDRDRIRWRCRRGMLELDLLLTRFLDRYIEKFDVGQLDDLGELLEYTDSDLLDLLMGRATLSNPRCQPILDLMRNT